MQYSKLPGLNAVVVENVGTFISRRMVIKAVTLRPHLHYWLIGMVCQLKFFIKLFLVTYGTFNIYIETL